MSEDSTDRLIQALRDMQTTIPTRVEVVAIDMPFLQMVWVMVKLALAAIPAMIILFLIVVALWALLALMGLYVGLMTPR